MYRGIDIITISTTTQQKILTVLPSSTIPVDEPVGISIVHEIRDIELVVAHWAVLRNTVAVRTIWVLLVGLVTSGSDIHCGIVDGKPGHVEKVKDVPDGER